MLESKDYKDRFSDFVEAAAHDLHSPLRKLSVLIDKLLMSREGQIDDRAKEYVGRIEHCIHEMRSLIDGLTALAKAEAGTMNDQCELGAIARETLGMMDEEIKSREALIEIDELPVVCGNLVQYKQLFRNLLENAVKFRRKDTPLKINIAAAVARDAEKKLHHLPAKKKYYRVEVSDNGIGFNQTYAEKIFEPFVRLHPKSRYEGNGLGLSICRKIISAHNGIIYAEGDEKTGSRFILLLPETP